MKDISILVVSFYIMFILYNNFLNYFYSSNLDFVCPLTHKTNVW